MRKMRELLWIILAFAFMTALCTRAIAESKEAYELLDRCGMRADQLFKDQFSVYNNYESSIARYKNHYNRRLNRCLIYVEVIATNGIMQGKKDDQLIDVNENSRLGSCSFVPDLPAQCVINSPEEIRSVTGTEWLTFVEKLMRE
jgi:hypothetical protein